MKLRLRWRDLRARLRRVRSNRAHVMIICGVFAVVLGGSVFAAKDPAGLFGSKGETGGGVAGFKSVGLTGVNGLGGDDPVLRFNETKVGQVVFSSRSDTCRRVLFDNRDGTRLEAGEVFCGQSPEQVVEPESNPRLQSLRKTFER